MEKQKHEKVIIGKGNLTLFRKAISILKKEDADFKKQMKGLPPIQKLPTHYYCYVPFDQARRLADIFDELQYS